MASEDENLKEHPKERWTTGRDKNTVREPYYSPISQAMTLAQPSDICCLHLCPKPRYPSFDGRWQSQLERAIYDIKRGANVSQLEDEYMTRTRERIIKEVRLASPKFCGEDATWVGWDRCKHRR